MGERVFDRRGSRALLAGLALASLPVGWGCSTTGVLAPDHCEIRVDGVERWDESAAGLDVAYQVRGRAGSAGTTWLVARNPSGSYLAGEGVEVGPGPFAAHIDLSLTGTPLEFVAMLEVAGQRCRADADKPR